MAIFNSYVKLPEGISGNMWIPPLLLIYTPTDRLNQHVYSPNIPILKCNAFVDDIRVYPRMCQLHHNFSLADFN